MVPLQQKKRYMVRILVLFLGLSIAHLGVTLFIQAGLGADPFNVMIQGIGRVVNGKHGTVHQIISFILLLTFIVTAREYVKAGTFICMFFGGPLIDGYTYLLTTAFPGTYPLVIRIAMVIAGCVVLAFGMTLVIKSDAGTGVNDLVSVVLSERLKKPFGRCRIIIDICFTVMGFILGGTIGAGTIICSLLVGVVAGKFMPYSEKIVQKIICNTV